ncbi:MAG: sigma 54-interacting transcriptional regulator [Deltaproteobacteria bacterium]|nr:sigma 54-interacting transcriptional regulator [Deltaproteobacteria bacterium]
MSVKDREEGTERIEGRTELTADLRAGRENEPRLQAFWDGGALSRPLPHTGSLTIGRSTSCDIRIDHASVSRKHAILHLGAVPRIEDAGSQNGTRVGGRPAISGAPLTITSGEVIEIGQVVLVLQGGEPPANRVSGTRAAAPPVSQRPQGRPIVGSATIAPPATRPNETPMQRVERLVRLVAAGNIHVVLLGETGVGKELIAERIHKSSRRAAGPFIRVDAASLTEPLLERELFGEGDKPGTFETADGGTFFLDEVSELPLGIQTRLLRVLERGETQRVGSTESHKVDVRFIAATNRDLRALVGDGAFREDLYFRLNGITIEIPPLRERTTDIEAIAKDLLAKACKDAGREPLELGKEALARLESYEWPGNVRELKNAIDRAVLLSTGDSIDPQAVPAGAHVGDAAAGARLRQDLASFERQRIIEALEKCAGNQTKAAQLLGISRRTLVSRLGEYNLPRPRGGGSK